MVPAYYNDNDPFCCKVLRKQISLGNLPPGDVDERDIRDVKAEDLEGYGHVHLFAGIGGFPLGFMRAGVPDDWRICTGGFPCQDISNAGKKIGIGGERSGLWKEMSRIVRDLRPDIVVVENVSALLGRGMDIVLGDLAACGFDAEWFVLPAASVGAPHIRERVFLVAHTDGQFGRTWWQGGFAGAAPWLLVPGEPRESPNEATTGIGNWTTEPGLVRLVHGVSPSVDRLRSGGNSIVPQVAEYIGRRILTALTPLESGPT